MPEDPSKKPLLSKEITSDRATVERMHKGQRNVTFTPQGAQELIRRIRSIGVQMVHPPYDNGKWREIFGRVGVHRQREVTDYSLKGKKGKPVPEGLLKVLQRRAGGMFNFYMNKVAGPLGIVTDPFFQYGAKEKYEFDKRLGTVTAYAMANPELAMKNPSELADFLFRESDQEMYENQLYGIIDDYKELNKTAIMPEYIEALHQEELWNFLESPSMLSDHPNLKGPTSVLDFKTQLPRLYFHGQKGPDPIKEFTQQRSMQWSESPQPEFGAGFFGSAGQALDIVSRIRQEGSEKEGYVLPDPEGVDMEVQLAELRKKMGAAHTTGSKVTRQGQPSLGHLPFAGVVNKKQIPAKWYAGVLDIKNPLVIEGDIGWWTAWNILGYMSNSPEFYNEPGQDSFPLQVNILQAENRPNYLGKFTYWPEENYFEENAENGNWNIPKEVRDTAYLGSGTAFQRVMEYAEAHANKELDEFGNPKTLKGLEVSEMTDEEYMDMYFDDMDAVTDYTESETYSSDMSSEEKEAIADAILKTPSNYLEDFNYFVNLGLKDFFLKDLGIDGIQFFNSIEDKLVSDWSYIILDGSQFKNIKQRKKAGEGFDKSKRPHMSKYNKQNKYRKVS